MFKQTWVYEPNNNAISQYSGIVGRVTKIEMRKMYNQGTFDMATGEWCDQSNNENTRYTLTNPTDYMVQPGESFLLGGNQYFMLVPQRSPEGAVVYVYIKKASGKEEIAAVNLANYTYKMGTYRVHNLHLWGRSERRAILLSGSEDLKKVDALNYELSVPLQGKTYTLQIGIHWAYYRYEEPLSGNPEPWQAWWPGQPEAFAKGNGAMVPQTENFELKVGSSEKTRDLVIRLEQPGKDYEVKLKIVQK